MSLLRIVRMAYPEAQETALPVVNGVLFEISGEEVILGTWDKHYRCVVRRIPLADVTEETVRQKVRVLEEIRDAGAVARRLTPAMRAYLESSL